MRHWQSHRLVKNLQKISYIGMKTPTETDHKISLWYFYSVQNAQTRFHLQFCQRLNQFNFRIHHTPGKDLRLAGTPSRASTTTPESQQCCIHSRDRAILRDCNSSLPSSQSLQTTTIILKLHNHLMVFVQHSKCSILLPAQTGIDFPATSTHTENIGLSLLLLIKYFFIITEQLYPCHYKRRL